MISNVQPIERLSARQKARVVDTCIGIMESMRPMIKDQGQSDRFEQRLARMQNQRDEFDQRADRLGEAAHD